MEGQGGGGEAQGVADPQKGGILTVDIRISTFLLPNISGANSRDGGVESDSRGLLFYARSRTLLKLRCRLHWHPIQKLINETKKILSGTPSKN
jgi:hypothetical protein